MVRRFETLPVWAVLILIGCGGEPVDDDASASPDAGLVTAPQIPWLEDAVPPIALTPCPAGWREVPPEGAAGLATCDPYPEGGPSDCAEDEAHFPGEPGCTTIGSACPVGEFADGLADDGTVRFVRAGATGGDGTRALPIGTIAEAMALASPG